MTNVAIGVRTQPQNVDWPTLEACWVEAARHDIFDSAWLNDHLTDQNRDGGGPSFEAMTALAALAHLVPGKLVGQTVLAATFRHPSVLAKEAVTIDNATGGRYVLALGAGWHIGEHTTLGIELPPIGERFDRYEAQIRVLKALFSDEARALPGVTLDAPPYRLEGATMEPGATRPGGPQLWLGGQRPRGLRLAARYADGWNYASNLDGSVPGFVERRDVLLRACEEIGRDPAELTLSVQITIPDDGAAREDAVARAIEYGRSGARHIMLTTPARNGAAGIRRLATEVAAPIRDALG